MMNWSDQQDDHCRITFMGEDWWIMAVRRHLILLTNENGQEILDISDVDWDAYIYMARQMMGVFE